VFDLQDKVAIVTGGGAGIGEATSMLFAQLGAAVTVADINAGDAERVAANIVEAGGRAIAIEVDVAEEAQVKAMIDRTVEEFGKLDVLFNNAAALNLIPSDPDVTAQDIEIWRKTMDVNLTGPMLGCKHAIPHMLANGGGSIINTGSHCGTRGELNMTAYGASKAGVIQLTRSVAAQFGKQGIRCNTLSPGLTMTPKALKVMPDDVKAIYERTNMLAYLGRPIDQAAMAAFLASDASAYVTGQQFTVDGGQANAMPIVAHFREWAQQQTPDVDTMNAPLPSEIVRVAAPTASSAR
jgi:NAD(P)-dependent dehydrogenase (short-subunit alcohol dehydrogenase family)